MIRYNLAANNIYSDLKNKSGKIVEVVGLLLGFIVVAVVEIPFENYACVSDYLKTGFTLALCFLLVSISLGLIVFLDMEAFYSTNNHKSTSEEKGIVKHLNELRILLNFSILFCGLGLFSVIDIVVLLIFKSLNLAFGFVLVCVIMLCMLVYWIVPYLESKIKKEG